MADDKAEDDSRLTPRGKRGHLRKNGETRKVEVQTLGPKALAALTAQRKRERGQQSSDE